MSTLEVDHSSLDVVASWFGQTLSKKRKSEDVDYSHQNRKEKHKKQIKRSHNGTGTLPSSDRAGQSQDLKPGRVSSLPQSQCHLKDATDLSVSSFIQGKVNKKLLKARHKKREQGLSVTDRGKTDVNRVEERHGPLGHDSSSGGEEESRLGLIKKQRPAPRVAPSSAKKRKRRRKKKSSET